MYPLSFGQPQPDPPLQKKEEEEIAFGGQKDSQKIQPPKPEEDLHENQTYKNIGLDDYVLVFPSTKEDLWRKPGVEEGSFALCDAVSNMIEKLLVLGH